MLTAGLSRASSRRPPRGVRVSSPVASEVEAGEAGPGGQEDHPVDVDDVDVDALLVEHSFSHLSHEDDHVFHPLRACQQFAVHVFFPFGLPFNSCGLGCTAGKNQVRLVLKGTWKEESEGVKKKALPPCC